MRAITWLNWGGTEAVGQGQVSLLDGSSEDYETPPGRTSPVTVTLGGLRQCAGMPVYTTYSLQLAAGAREPSHWPKGQTGSFPCTPMVMTEFAAPTTPRVGRRSQACGYPLAALVSTKEEPRSVTVSFKPKPPSPTFFCSMRFHSWGGKTAFADGLLENLTNDHATRRNWPATIELSGRTPKTLSSFGHRGLKARVFWQHMHPTPKACQLGYSLENPFPDSAAAAGQIAD